MIKDCLTTIFVILICIMLCFNGFRIILSEDNTSLISAEVFLSSLADFQSDMDGIFDAFTDVLGELVVVADEFAGVWANFAAGSRIPVLNKILALIVWPVRFLYSIARLINYVVVGSFKVIRSLLLIYRDILKLIGKILGINLFGGSAELPELPAGWSGFTN